MQFNMYRQPLPPFPYTKQPVAISFTDSDASGSNVTTYTFSSKSIGDAAPDRYILVAINAVLSTATNCQVNSVVIGGVSASLVSDGANDAQVNAAGGNRLQEAHWIAAVPTGTTADVVVTLNGTGTNMQIILWRLTGISSTTANDVATDSNADPINLPLDIPANGAAAASVQGPATVNAVWTNLTEDVDNVNNFSSGASGTFETAQTALAISADISGSGSATGVATSWG